MDGDSILRAWAHNEGYCVTSDNARRRSEPRRSRHEAEARSVLRALSRVSIFPELCALARILFYVTSVRIRVFMRTLESNLVL